MSGTFKNVGMFTKNITIDLSGWDTSNVVDMSNYEDENLKDEMLLHLINNLITITINNDGVFLNNQLVNKKVTLDDLKLKNHNRLLFSLYNKLDAEFYGGFNLFGKGFGNHEQDIVLSAICEVSEENQVSI